MPTPPFLKKGAKLGHYVTHSYLGGGAMGQAYLATHPVMRAPVVVKVVLTDDPEPALAEAHLAARVWNDRVVAVFDAGAVRFRRGAGWMNGVYTVQRYVDGLNLDELREHANALGRDLPLGLACRILADAARGLHVIHQAGVIHRDVKPANLFLGGDGKAVVGDFGISTPYAPGQASGFFAGTPDFAAPEVWRGDSVERATDVYALGATGHQLLTGSTVFSADTFEGIGRCHLLDEYHPPERSDPHEVFVFGVLRRALQKRPVDRYASAWRMASDLGLFASRRPALQRSSTIDGWLGFGFGGVSLRLGVADLTTLSADVLVNAANQQMTLDKGLARRMREAAGPSLEREANSELIRLGGAVRMSDVVWTRAGRLNAREVAHAVAADEGIEGAVCIGRTVLRVLLEAERRRARSIVLPALGTGHGLTPMVQGARLMLEAIRTFAEFEPQHLRDVRVALLDPANPSSHEPLENWLYVLESVE